MKFKNTKKKRVISFALVILIVGGLIPSDMLSGFFGLFAPAFASAADNNAPAYQYMNELLMVQMLFLHCLLILNIKSRQAILSLSEYLLQIFVR